MSDLLPCPFCGSDAEKSLVHGIEVAACSIASCVGHHVAATPSNWNRRHAPNGWQMVPVEPTSGMQVAGLKQRYDEDSTRGVYRAMLAVAPRPGGGS